MPDWKNDSLRRLFHPKSVAVMGASDRPEKLGALAMLALGTYPGTVYPVNPRISKLGKLDCYPDIKSIGDEVDMVMIALSTAQVIPALEDCAAAGVGAAVIFTAGFKELGSDGAARQARLREIADGAHIAVIGPNCLGAGNINLGLNATFFPHPMTLKKGSTAILSQSGGVCGQMLYRAADVGLGISKFVSVGNRVNIDFDSLLKYLRDDPETSVVCMFVEGTERAREMYRETSLVTERKPVIAFKVGRTPASMRAAVSHTGSLAGSAELYSACFKQARATEVSSVSEMIDTAKIFAVSKNRPTGRRVAVLTHTLGTALVAAQALEENGGVVPVPSEGISSQIEQLLQLPVRFPISNPIDLLATGWSEPRIFADAFRIIIESNEFDALLAVFSPNYQEEIGGGLPIADMTDAAKASKKTVVCVLNSPETKPPPGMDRLEEAGIPCFSSPERAGKALANVIRSIRETPSLTRQKQ